MYNIHIYIYIFIERERDREREREMYTYILDGAPVAAAHEIAEAPPDGHLAVHSIITSAIIIIIITFYILLYGLYASISMLSTPSSQSKIRVFSEPTLGTS